MSTPSSPPAPPPPPPPPVIPASQTRIPNERSNANCNDELQETSKSQLLDKAFSSLEDESRKAYSYVAKTLKFQDDNSWTFIAGYKPITPVIQNGPVCGMVALAMASEVVGAEKVSTEDILAEAKERGYSKQGEMYSASSMQALASHFLTAQIDHVSFDSTEDISKVKRQIICNLMLHKVVLQPYDSDKDHGPCLKKGHKAHWALLSGFFIAVHSSNLQQSVKNICKTDPDIPSLLYWPSGNCDENISESNITSLLDSDKNSLYVFGHQGKSKYAGLWSLDTLIQSTLNLVEAGPERDSEDYVIPEGGVGHGLKGQCIFISPKS